jgi:hypothetical protein
MLRLSAGPDRGFAKPLRPRALDGARVSKKMARVAQGFGAQIPWGQLAVLPCRSDMLWRPVNVLK